MDGWTKWDIHSLALNAQNWLIYYHSIDQCPANLLPVTILGYPLTPTATNFSPFTIHPKPVSSIPSTFHQYVRSLPTTEQSIIGHVLQFTPSDLHKILETISTGDFSLGSDGSVIGTHSTYSSRIQHNLHQNIFIQLYAKLTITSSSIAEGYSDVSVLYLLRALIHFFHYTLTNLSPINCYIDNEGVLKRLQYSTQPSIKHI